MCVQLVECQLKDRRCKVANVHLFLQQYKYSAMCRPLLTLEFERGTRDFEQTKNQTPAQG